MGPLHSPLASAEWTNWLDHYSRADCHSEVYRVGAIPAPLQLTPLIYMIPGGRGQMGAEGDSSWIESDAPPASLPVMPLPYRTSSLPGASLVEFYPPS